MRSHEQSSQSVPTKDKSGEPPAKSNKYAEKDLPAKKSPANMIEWKQRQREAEERRKRAKEAQDRLERMNAEKAAAKRRERMEILEKKKLERERKERQRREKELQKKKELEERERQKVEERKKRIEEARLRTERRQVKISRRQSLMQDEALAKRQRLQVEAAKVLQEAQLYESAMTKIRQNAVSVVKEIARDKFGRVSYRNVKRLDPIQLFMKISEGRRVKQISKAQFQIQMLKVPFELTRLEAAACWEGMDPNGDGNVSQQELCDCVYNARNRVRMIRQSVKVKFPELSTEVQDLSQVQIAREMGQVEKIESEGDLKVAMGSVKKAVQPSLGDGSENMRMQSLPTEDFEALQLSLEDVKGFRKTLPLDLDEDVRLELQRRESELAKLVRNALKEAEQHQRFMKDLSASDNIMNANA